VQHDIKVKERARDALSKRYRNSQLSSDDVLWAVYSLSDNNSYLLFNRDPIDKMISLFQRWEGGGLLGQASSSCDCCLNCPAAALGCSQSCQWCCFFGGGRRSSAAQPSWWRLPPSPACRSPRSLPRPTPQLRPTTPHNPWQVLLARPSRAGLLAGHHGRPLRRAPHALARAAVPLRARLRPAAEAEAEAEAGGGGAGGLLRARCPVPSPAHSLGCTAASL
jgi:hypothetical protein